jgi:steroid 5-alpha reductase family enzyme/predicted DCC family thiol-disulfide oxidoreductase YuxK
MSAWFIVARIKKRSDLADTAWGLGFVFVAWLSYFLSNSGFYGLIVNGLVTLWGVRLALHIYLRNKSREQDFRYKPTSALKMFFQVYVLQGVILYIVALPILWIHTHPESLNSPILTVAIPLWVFGFVFEALGDAQLAYFKKDPANHGKLLMTGLWSYVRHPNYLGELAQWWAIWLLAVNLPYGPYLIVSPLLLTYLIVYVSGVAPLEEKMKSNHAFKIYSATTASMLPTSLLNGLIYTVAWSISIHFGVVGPSYVPFLSFVAAVGAQVALFYFRDQRVLLVSLPLAVYAIVFGLIQEMAFIHFGVLSYPTGTLCPPFWLLYLYPLFSLTLNSSFNFLNKSLPLTFFVGGFGSLISYYAGERLGGVQFGSDLSYPIIGLSWGVFLALLVVLNRKLVALENTYTTHSDVPLTVFFDSECPICNREMETLKKRKQTGVVNYACPTSDAELVKITKAFSFADSMKKIHAIDGHGNIITGTEALAAVYSKTDLAILSVLIQAPGFKPFFKVCYAIWARFRK